MKIVFSYKQTGVAKTKLESKLKKIRDIFTKLKVDNYIFYLDEEKNLEAAKIMNKVESKIKSSDLLIVLIDYKEKSEGQLLELGIAKGLGKDILILLKKEVKDKYFLIYGLNSKIKVFNNTDEIEILLYNYLKGK